MSLKFCLISWCDQICSSSLHHGLAWQHTARMPGGNMYVLVVLKTCGGLHKRIIIMSKCAQRVSVLLPGVWGEWGHHGGRGEGGPSPPGGGKDKQSVPNKGRDNMGKDEEDQPSRTWWRRIGAYRVSSLLIKLNFVNVTVKVLILITVLSFRRINHVALRNHLQWSSV